MPMTFFFVPDRYKKCKPMTSFVLMTKSDIFCAGGKTTCIKTVASPEVGESDPVPDAVYRRLDAAAGPVPRGLLPAARGRVDDTVRHPRVLPLRRRGLLAGDSPQLGLRELCAAQRADLSVENTHKFGFRTCSPYKFAYM